MKFAEELLPKMEDLKQFELRELIDKLAEQTSQYLVMVKMGVLDNDYRTCKENIQKIQSEIKVRRGGNSIQLETKNDNHDDS